jgi:hypothetical protein
MAGRPIPDATNRSSHMRCPLGFAMDSPDWALNRVRKLAGNGSDRWLVQSGVPCTRHRQAQTTPMGATVNRAGSHIQLNGSALPPRAFGPGLLHVKEERTINHGWKAQPGRKQQIKPHALPLLCNGIRQIGPEIRSPGDAGDSAVPLLAVYCPKNQVFTLDA